MGRGGAGIIGCDSVDDAVLVGYYSAEEPERGA